MLVENFNLFAYTNATNVPHFNDPDPDYVGTIDPVSNKTRADFVAEGLRSFTDACQMSEPVEDVVADFLCDLHHFCDGHGLNLATLLDRAKANYLVESDHDRHNR